MAITNPLSITYPAPISSGAISLPKVNFGDHSGDYTSADGNDSVGISHQIGGRTRRLLRLDHQKISPDVFVPSSNVLQKMSLYIVLDQPTGPIFTNAEMKAVYDGFKAMFTASSDALIVSWIAGES